MLVIILIFLCRKTFASEKKTKRKFIRVLKLISDKEDMSTKRLKIHATNFVPSALEHTYTHSHSHSHTHTKKKKNCFDRVEQHRKWNDRPDHTCNNIFHLHSLLPADLFTPHHPFSFGIFFFFCILFGVWENIDEDVVCR